MSTDLGEITRVALALAPEERMRLAQRLWESLDEATRRAATEPDEAGVAEAQRRDEELSSGQVQPQTHEQAMRAAREAIQ